eukprot:TRINITY_DN31424_c0_g1_i1.p1 TRINITY_DN31424_c0_g1~~TRINITY_DN31424_c0_g1_i1.p1  ORF type:complete len:784 (+),score=272.29 TRINITY_DN31424_c0_g1_i1:89-2353(+)
MLVCRTARFIQTSKSLLREFYGCVATVPRRSFSLAVVPTTLRPTCLNNCKQVARLGYRPFELNSRRTYASSSVTTYEEPIGARLIPIVNQLQEVCSLVGEEGISLPQIVVIGGQSSGKSSVLENLVGRDFLPRGAGLVTRRPLVLQLNRLPNANDIEWGEFAHKPGQRFNFDEIKREISLETERLVGRNKGISPEPIILKIFSPNVLPLTLVDTPGITRVPVGDQPIDIENRIREMILGFVKQPNAIILAVQPATQDLETSDALNLARMVDIEGRRTIGVLTKIDMMDQGTNALNILTGRAYPLQLGFIGVVSRSQMHINSAYPINHMLRDEEKFFGDHPLYSSVAKNCGTRHLALVCNQLLSNHIQKVLPSIRQQIRKLVKEKQEELMAYGTPLATDKASQGWLLLHLVNKVSDSFRAAIDGVSAEVTTNELNGGARIRYIFHDTFAKQLGSLDPLEGLSVNDIKNAIRNAAGPKPALFVPEAAFELLMKRQIERLREPAKRCAEMTLDELLRIVTNLDNKELNRFRILRNHVIDVANNTLRKCLKPCNKMIDDLFRCELSYINTNHPDFMGVGLLERASAESVPQPARVEEEHDEPLLAANPQNTQNRSGFFSTLFGPSRPPAGSSPSPAAVQRPPSLDADLPSRLLVPDTLSEQDKKQIRLIRELIRSYFKIVQKNMQDSVTKAVMAFLVNNAKESLQRELMAELYKEELFDKLLQEEPRTAQRRHQLGEQVEALKKAKKIVQFAELRDFE